MTIEELLNELRPHRTDSARRASVTNVMHRLERFSQGTAVDPSITVESVLDGSTIYFSMQDTEDNQGLLVAVSEPAPVS